MKSLFALAGGLALAGTASANLTDPLTPFAVGAPTDADPALLSIVVSEDVTAKIGGRVHLDWTWATGDDAYDTDDGVEFRRARLHVEGTLYDTVDYKVEFDFAGGDADWRDVYMGLKDTGFGDLKVGHFKEPFSLEEQTSSRHITFIERSVANSFAPMFNTGVMLQDVFADDMATWQVGVFRDTDDFGNDNNTSDPAERDAEYAFTGRLAGTPIHDEDTVLHLGIAGSLRNADDGTVRYRSRPEAHLLNNVADTGAIPADQVVLGGLEVAWVEGPLSLQGEYMLSSVDGQTSADDADFSGYYVEGSYFLTGEMRPYKIHGARFDRVKPLENHTREGGSGAHQLALRYSNLDLDDGPGTVTLDGITLGYNWYLNPNAAVKVNYVHSEVDDGSIDDSADIFVVRFQFDF